MTPASDPSRAFVLVVGVERSRIFDLDPLVGPVADAIRCFDWAVAHGVPTSRIRMFVSPKPVSQPLLDAWQARRGDAVLAAATEAAIQDFIGTGLQPWVPKDGAGLLLVMWSGHGLIDQRGAARTRRLFYADSSPQLPRHLEVTGLLNVLKTRRYAGFSEQVFVVDACASFSAGLFGSQSLGAPTNLGLAGAPAALRQWVMLAASPGQAAETEVVTVAGTAQPASKFVQRLFERLDRPEAPAQAAPGPWPDFRRGFLDTRASFEGDGQWPVSWAYGLSDDGLDDDGRLLLSSAHTTRLATAVQAAGLAAPALRDAFVAALGPLALAESHEQALQQGLAAMVELLGDAARPAAGPTALQRFALEVAVRAPQVEAAEVLAWLRRGLDDDGLRRELGQRRAVLAQASAVLCFVLIDEAACSTRDDAVELRAWLFVAKDPVPVLLADDQEPLLAGDAGSRAVALGTLLGRAYAEAANKGISAPTLVLEFALPLERIGEEVEAQLFNDGFVDLPVGRRYAVVRRIAERVRALGSARSAAGRRLLPLLAAWRTAATLLRERFERHGIRLVWIDPQGVVDGQLESELARNPQGSCVGLKSALEAGRLTAPARNSLACGAIPFACWARGAWSKADTARLEGDLGGCADQAALERMFELRRRAGFATHPSTRLAILWDDPARDPYAERLQA